MRFALLGPLTVGTGDQAVELAAGIPRTILTTLLLNANSVLGLEQLADSVWGDDRPAAAVASLRNHVARLRRRLGPEAGARIRTVTPGYLVEVQDGELDEQVFVDGCRRGRQALQAGEWAAASDVLTDALALWRGEPFAGVPVSLDIGTALRRLEETRLLAWEGRNEADLRLGRHQELIATIRTQAHAHPLQEVFHGQLMLALYRADRQAEALEVFRDLRRTLTRELGVDPSASIRQLHTRILEADPQLAAPAPAAATGTAPGAAAAPAPEHGSPRFQLPADTAAFTGRGWEVDQLLARALDPPAGTGAAVVCAIDGMGGIGKSALAVHAAHRVRTAFPDGQLFIDLHGHTSGIAPLSSGDALNWALRSLGVPPQLIPQDPDQRVAFYRDRLADTRTLIVLDNAVSTAQIRPLLPAASGCLVLITSRRRLTGLDDAHTLTLDVLPRDDAMALLHAVAGPERVPADHPAAEELLSLCGYLPLAIRITAARLRHRRTLRVEDVVARLRDEHGRLDRFRDEERSLAAVFESSYAALPAAEQRLFRLLGVVPGADVDARAAAHLVQGDQRRTELLLESLLDHNLLTQYSAGRYRLHDLVRLHARGRGADDEAEAKERDGARERLLDHYQQSATAAAHHLADHPRPRPAPAREPARDREPAPAPAPDRGTDPSPATAPAGNRELPESGGHLTDRESALTWMRAERDNLLDAAADAATPPARAVALTAALATFLYQEGPWSQAAELHRRAAVLAHRNQDPYREAEALGDLGQVHLVAADAAASVDALSRSLAIFERLGDRSAEADTLWGLGRAHYLADDFTAATAVLERALVIFQDAGDRRGEANALWDLGRVRLTAGDYPQAAGLYERALAIFQDSGQQLGGGNALWDLGRVRLTTEDHPQAAGLYERALTIFRNAGHRPGEANALWDLGRIRYATADYPAAADLLERAFAIFRDLGNRLGEAYALWDLGRVRLATGESGSAAELHRRALALFRDLGSRSGEAHALHELGRAGRASGQHEAATELLEQALALFRESGDRRGEQEVARSMAAAGPTRTGSRG